MKQLIIFLLFILTVIATITMIMCVRDLFRIILYRNRIYLIIKTLVESPLPASIINKILPDSINKIPDERIQFLNYVFHGTANENIWDKRTNKKNYKRAFQYFKASSQGLLSNEYFIKSTHRLLGSSIFIFTHQNIICKKEFWTNLYLKGDEYIYWPKFFFEDREFILRKYASCTQYENRNLPLFIYLPISLKSDKEFVKNLLREHPYSNNYKIISDNIPRNLKTVSFFKEIIHLIDHEILEYAPKELKLNEDFELIKSLYAKKSKVIHYASPSIKADKKHMIELSKIDNYCLKYLDKSIRLDFEFYNECLKNEIRILKYLPREISDYESLVIGAVSKSLREAQYIPEDLMSSKDFIVHALAFNISLFPIFYKNLNSEFSSFLFFTGDNGTPFCFPKTDFQSLICNVLKEDSVENFNFVDFFYSVELKSNKINIDGIFHQNDKKFLTLLQRKYDKLIDNKYTRSEFEVLQKELVNQTQLFFRIYHPKTNLSLLHYYCYLTIKANTKYGGGLGNI